MRKLLVCTLAIMLSLAAFTPAIYASEVRISVDGRDVQFRMSTPTSIGDPTLRWFHLLLYPTSLSCYEMGRKFKTNYDLT